MDVACNEPATPTHLDNAPRKHPQALYFCEPLRHHLAQVREEDANNLSGGGGDNNSGTSSGAHTGKGRGGASNNSLLSQLAELFASISKQKRRSGHLAPTEFLRTLRERNELFRGNMQQVQETPTVHSFSKLCACLYARTRACAQCWCGISACLVHR